MSREYLVTKFKCAACGSMLRLSYEAPKTSVDYAEGQPTGAQMVQQIVAIEPCFQCTKPAREVSQALNTLIKHGATK